MLMLHIDTTVSPTATRLSIHGQLDMTASMSFDYALDRAARAGGLVEIDLGRVDFIDGSGLSLLIDAESRARQAGQALRIVAASRNVRRLIDITETAERISPFVPARDGWLTPLDRP
jgi:anti-sigma B factor antagonist